MADALQSAGESMIMDGAAETSPIDPAPSPEQAHFDAVQRKMMNAVPGDRVVLAETLREPNLPLQLLALDQLGDMAPWDTEARRILEAFRNTEGNEGLQQRAEYLLSSVPRLPIAVGPVDPAAQDHDGPG